MTCNNPSLDMFNINADTNSVTNLSICSQDIERNRNPVVNQGKNSGTNRRKMTCNNPNLDLVNIKSYTKFGDKSVNLFSRY